MDEAEFGRYRLLGLIGEGGMGQVFKARDTAIGRDVAIKVLASELATEPGYQARFRREAHTAAQLTEPHVIPIFDTGEINGRLYLVMPVVDGIDVASVLRRDGPMSPRLAVRVIDQLAAALDAAHAQGLVHRDVKPSNALMTGTTGREFVYLIDFGIAHTGSATKLTRTGSVVGSLAYMAPERFTTGKADPRADIYALACVLHECLTGSQPFPGDSMEQQIAGHLTLNPPRPSVQRPGAPAAFDDVIARGMAKNPDERYQSAQDLATAAERALTEPTQVASRYTVPTLIDDTGQPGQATAEPSIQDQPADLIGAPTQWRAAGSPTLDANAQPPMQLAPPHPPATRPDALTSWRNRLILAIAGAAVVSVAIAAVAGYFIFGRTAPTSGPAVQPALPSGQAAQPVAPPAQAAQPAPSAKVQLYQQFESASAVGANGQPINATLAGESYPTSTGMWVGCNGRPATTTYRLNHQFTELNAVVGLQPHTPDGLTVFVTISGDGQVLKEFTIGKTANIPVDLTLRGMDSLVVAAILESGTCGASTIPYGALGDASLAEVSG